jgi:hypothetical protein
MTEERIQYKRGRSNKRVLPHHTNLRRQEILTRDIRICNTITQLETFSLLTSEMDTSEDKLEKVEAIIQD